MQGVVTTQGVRLFSALVLDLRGEQALKVQLPIERPVAPELPLTREQWQLSWAPAAADPPCLAIASTGSSLRTRCERMCPSPLPPTRCALCLPPALSSAAASRLKPAQTRSEVCSRTTHSLSVRSKECSEAPHLSHEAGFDVLFLPCNGLVFWTPDAQSLALVPKWQCAKLRIHRLPSGARLSVQLPVSSISSACIAWSPTSQQLLCVAHGQIFHVCARTAVILSQQQPAWLWEAATVVWGSTGIVAVHAHNEDGQGRISLCSVSGAEHPVLHVLHVLQTGACVSNLSFPCSGLLLVFADHGAWTQQPTSSSPGYFVGRHSRKVTVCTVLSGRTAIVAECGQRPSDWDPCIPRTARELSPDLGVMVAWMPDGHSLLVASPTRHMPGRTHRGGRKYSSETWTFRQLSFKCGSRRQRLPWASAVAYLETPQWLLEWGWWTCISCICCLPLCWLTGLVLVVTGAVYCVLGAACWVAFVRCWDLLHVRLVRL